MKARNPNTGTLETVYVKALDSMPVGSQVEFTGNTIPAGWEEVNDYSTTEIDTGKKWIDGKKIYRKVINFGALPNATTKEINTDITNIDRVISISGYAYDGSNTFIPLPHSNPNPVSLVFLKNTGKIQVQTTINRSSFTESYIILEYTKSS